MMRSGEAPVGLGRLAADFVAMAKRLVDESGIHQPPIDPARLASLQGIRRIVVSRTLQSSGQLIQDGKELLIQLNAREPVERQNFSCCHEIAHTFASHVLPSMTRMGAHAPSCPRSSHEEAACDFAAAEMLMPEKFFRPLAADLQPTVTSVVTLARLFGSSVRATILRLGQLGVWPVIFIVWRFAIRPGSSRKLRVWWSVRPADSRCFVPMHAPADRASGMYATFTTSHPTFEHETLDLGSLRGSYLLENAKFGEHVVSIVHEPRWQRGSHRRREWGTDPVGDGVTGQRLAPLVSSDQKEALHVV